MNNSGSYVRLGNPNEQYSRKHNFKVMGVNKKDKENGARFPKIKHKRLPGLSGKLLMRTESAGKRGEIEPISIKLANIKAHVKRRRSEIN